MKLICSRDKGRAETTLETCSHPQTPRKFLGTPHPSHQKKKKKLARVKVSSFGSSLMKLICFRDKGRAETTRDQNANFEKRLQSAWAFAGVVACAQRACTTGPWGLGNRPSFSGVQGVVFLKRIEWFKPLSQYPLYPYPHTSS